MGSERLSYDTELEVVEQGVEPRSPMAAETSLCIKLSAQGRTLSYEQSLNDFEDRRYLLFSCIDC